MLSCDGEVEADEYWMSAETLWICVIARGQRDYGGQPVCMALKHFTLFLLINGRNAGIKITHGAILRFFAQRGHVPPIIAKVGTRRKRKIPYVICHISRRSVGHIYLGISSPINFNNPEFCKFIRLVRTNRLIHIHEIYKFYAPIRSTKTF